jgi:hypothetical protein
VSFALHASAHLPCVSSKPQVVAAQMVVVLAVWADVASAFATWRFLREPV